jgi:hypothetical protein
MTRTRHKPSARRGVQGLCEDTNPVGTESSPSGLAVGKVERMSTRMRRGDASGSGDWLLMFLQARDSPPRRRLGTATGPGEWLLVFLEAARAGRLVGAGLEPVRAKGA